MRIRSSSFCCAWRSFFVVIPALMLFACRIGAGAAEKTDEGSAALELKFDEAVQPFLKSYCFVCHGTDTQEGKLDLSVYSSLASVNKDEARWKLVLERLQGEEMPPEDADERPSRQERETVIGWIRAFRADEARRRAGDPGPLLARRLSNAEYDYTIRDLAGVDIRPTREFPVDPANMSGFDNSGESLAMSPALLKKYLDAARHVADHLVLQPEGFAFAPHPVVTDTDRDKYCVQRIISFYQRQPVDIADYLLAAWRFEHRDALGKPSSELADYAQQTGISTRYLRAVWTALTNQDEPIGPIASVQRAWRNLPEAGADAQVVLDQCRKLRDSISRVREQLASEVAELRVRGISRGSQPLVLWKNRQEASNRMRYVGENVTADWQKFEESDLGPPPDARPAASEDQRRAALDRFCQIFPDAFYVSERDSTLETSERNKGRLLSAGFHLMSGYFRDDQPLCRLILDEQGQRELDTLWQELDFVASAPMRQYRDFIFFERAEPPRFLQEAKFDFARSEDKDAIAPDKMTRLSELYLAKSRENGASDRAAEAIAEYLSEMASRIRAVEKSRVAAEPSHLAALHAFAQRAYRRPLSQEEADELSAFYSSLRTRELLGHEDAMRDTVASILLSPFFCYRIAASEPGAAASPLPDYALASRLSYFLWASMPDTELLAHAAAGDLQQPDVLVSQARRMLEDSRAVGLATEFGGNWLDFRRFEQHNGVDRDRFSTFTPELRQAMYEEPIRFFLDVVRENRSVLDFLYAEDTFVNPVLAKHYGIDSADGPPSAWRHVEKASQYGRGGLLPMSVFLTQNSPGLRTSPVKRGYWVVRRLLGERIPPPPPKVPELPADESQTGDLTLPQMLAKHRENKSCATCHDRFDSIGLAFEGYGPIGERRDKDLGGRPIEDRASFPGGGDGAGIQGLRAYLRDRRQAEFVDNFCRKLLAYALGRSLLLSDETTLEEIQSKLAADGFRFFTVVQSIVTSPQFRMQRGRDEHSQEQAAHASPRIDSGG